jgi:hypothetical protein
VVGGGCVGGFVVAGAVGVDAVVGAVGLGFGVDGAVFEVDVGVEVGCPLRCDPDGWPLVGELPGELPAPGDPVVTEVGGVVGVSLKFG